MMFKKIQTSVSDILDFPADVAAEGPKITIIGKSQVLVENYLSIINFSGEEVRLETSDGAVCITGKGLVLKVLLPTELQIEGEVASLSFEGGVTE